MMGFFAAKHMFAPFSHVNNDNKPVIVKITGKGSEFSTTQNWNRTSEVTSEPTSIVDRNLIRQAWFCFLNFVFGSLSVVSYTENMCVST